MKSAILAIALLTGGAAVAQDYQTTTTTTDTGMMMTTHSAPASGQVVMPSNADPEHDARGIAVISDPAMVPAGFNGTMGGVGGPLDETTAAASMTAEPSYMACSSTVTDNCVQTYERGRSPD